MTEEWTDGLDERDQLRAAAKHIAKLTARADEVERDLAKEKELWEATMETLRETEAELAQAREDLQQARGALKLVMKELESEGYVVGYGEPDPLEVGRLALDGQMDWPKRCPRCGSPDPANNRYDPAGIAAPGLSGPCFHAWHGPVKYDPQWAVQPKVPHPAWPDPERPE